MTYIKCIWSSVGAFILTSPQRCSDVSCISRPCLADRNSLLSVLENFARWREALMFGEDNGEERSKLQFFFRTVEVVPTVQYF